MCFIRIHNNRLVIRYCKATRKKTQAYNPRTINQLINMKCSNNPYSFYENESNDFIPNWMKVLLIISVSAFMVQLYFR